MIKKIKRLLRLIYFFIVDEEFLFFHLMKWKAQDCIEDCCKLEVDQTEELEDLILHVCIYEELPNVVSEVQYPQFKGLKVQNLIEEYKKGNKTLKEVDAFSDFLVEIETQRAIERDIIFDLAKSLTFGFKM